MSGYVSMYFVLQENNTGSTAFCSLFATQLMPLCLKWKQVEKDAAFMRLAEDRFYNQVGVQKAEIN